MSNVPTIYIYSLTMANSGKLTNLGKETIYLRFNNPKNSYVCSGQDSQGLKFTLSAGNVYYPEISVSCNPATTISFFEDNMFRDNQKSTTLQCSDIVAPSYDERQDAYYLQTSTYTLLGGSAQVTVKAGPATGGATIDVNSLQLEIQASTYMSNITSFYVDPIAKDDDPAKYGYCGVSGASSLSADVLITGALLIVSGAFLLD